MSCTTRTDPADPTNYTSTHDSTDTNSLIGRCCRRWRVRPAVMS
jgi:hypothetical protein